MLEELKACRNRVIGTKQVLKAIGADGLKKVYVAQDADDFIKSKLLDAARGKEIEIVMVPSMKELGDVCCIDVGAAAAGIRK